MRPIQPIKLWTPNDFTEEGIVIDVRPVQPLKHLSPNDVTDEGIETEVSSVQYMKQLAPIDVTVYSAPYISFTLSGTIMSPEYAPLLYMSSAVFFSESNI